MTELILFFLLGLSASLIGSLVGLGGGFLIVPIASLALGLSFREAAFISLVAVFVMSVLHNFQNRNLIKIYRDRLWPLGISTATGALLFTWLGLRVESFVLEIAFGILMITVGFWFFFSKRQSDVGATPQNPWLGRLTVFLSGSFPALFGIGGGIVAVPVLSRLEAVSLKDAVRLSFVLQFFAASTSLVFQIQNPSADIQNLRAAILVTHTFGAVGGFLLSRRISLGNDGIRKLFSFILVFLGALKLWSAF